VSAGVARTVSQQPSDQTEDLVHRVVSVGVSVALVMGLGACQKTDNGDLQVKVPEVDVKVRTETVPTPNLPNVDVKMKTDTISTPTVGRKRTEVRRPTVETKRP
jgi:hypothetical protein